MKDETEQIIFYKYRGWEGRFQKEMLLNQELYLSPPSKFNDPFDSTITANFLDLTDSEIKEYFDYLYTKHKDLNKGNFIAKQLLIDDFKKDKKKFQENHDMKTLEMYDKHLGIISMSKIWNSILMWSHYSENHYGYCIGFNIEKLMNLNCFGSWGEVEYDKDYPKIKPIEDEKNESFFKVVYSKAEEWGYEKEIRLSKINRMGYLLEDDRKVNYPVDVIEEIIIGLKSTDDCKNKIINFAEQHKIPVYKIVKLPRKFSLDRVRII